MKQNFGFKAFLKQPILEGTKTYTTRIETPFRLKCDKGDIGHFFTGVRTKEMKKFADVRIINRWRWNQALLIDFYYSLEEMLPIKLTKKNYRKMNSQLFPIGLSLESPINVNWNIFAIKEGFNNVNEFAHYFCQKAYLYKNLITYQFEIINQIPLMISKGGVR